MTCQDLIQQLVELPDVDTQRRFLKKHASLQSDEGANALKAQADQFLRSDVHRSQQTAELILYLAGLSANPLHRALGLLAKANVQGIALGDYHDAIEQYDKAAAIYEANDRPARQARSQIGKLVALTRLGRYSEALEAGEWASEVLEAHAQWRPLADLTLNLGFIRSRLGEDTESLEQYDRARELYGRLGPEGEAFFAWVDHDRAIALRNLGQFAESLQAGQSAMEMLTQLGQEAEAARARQNLALTYFVLGRYNEALVLYDQVRDVFLADGRQRDAILVELFISDCLLQLRRFTDVLARCRQIRERFTELGTRFEPAQALLNETVAYAGLGRHSEAMASLTEARRLFTKEGNRVWIACADLEMAAILLRQGRFDESLAMGQACAEIFQAYGLPIQQARAHLVAARGMAALDQHDKALQLVAKTLAVSESRDIPSLTYQSHHLIGTLAAAGGNARLAMAEYDIAIQELERLRGRLMIEFRPDFLEDKQLVYEDMVDLCIESAQPLQALEVAERAKSRALLDLLAYRLDLSVQARGPADLPLVKELERCRSRRDRLYRRWESREDTPEEDWTEDDTSRQGTRQEILALEKQIADLWHRMLIRNAGYAREASLWQIRTEPVQPYLAPGTALLEYFCVHDQLVAFVVTGDAVQVQRLPGALAQVERLVQLLWLNLKTVPSSTPHQAGNLTRNAQRLLQRLHELLIAPLSELLASHPHLIIVPHGPLHYLPFHAFHNGQSYLLEQHEISYLPAASLLRYCRELRPETSGVLTFGHSHGERLPHTVEEARRIAELLSERAFVEEEATLARLRQEAPGCRVIHLATHGEFRSDNPLFSGLALADGWLTTLDIFDLRLEASLVTLSACQTGQNVIGGGDELLGLMRAFISAGSASVVLSLWTVEDRSTAHLMETFYRKLAAGWTKGAALRFAQRQLLEGPNGRNGDAEAAYAHPYFWAPFFLVGDAGAL